MAGQMRGQSFGSQQAMEKSGDEADFASYKQLLLVLESGEQGAWVLPYLPRYLEPENYACKVAVAMEDISQAGWIHADPETFWEDISLRRESLHQMRVRYQHVLESAGFSHVESEVTDMSEEGQRHLLDALETLETQEEKTNNTVADEHTLLLIGATQGRAENNPKRPTSSFASHLASHSPSSVLILKRPPDLHTEGLSILFATDGTEASQRAARNLPRLIRTDRAEVTLLTIVNPIYLENPIIAPYVNLGAVDESYRQNSEMLLSMTKGILEAQGLNVVNTMSAIGSPGWELLEQMKNQNPDLVVVGSHNRPGGAAWLLGSVSQRAVQAGAHNILVIR